MPTTEVTFGPLAGLYVGVAGSNDVLTQVLAERSEGSRVTEGQDEEFELALGNSEPTSNLRVVAVLNFIEIDSDVINLARGNALSESINTPSSFAKYAVLLLHNQENLPTSVYLPSVYTLKKLDLSVGKERPVPTSIIMACEMRNPFDQEDEQQLSYFGTWSELAEIMEDRSPI